jgi:hypothetical protein
MSIEDVLKNPAVRRAIEAGEEKFGKAVGKLLSSERVTTGLSSLVSGAMQAKRTIDEGVKQALHAANLPSREDVAALRRRIDELESMLDGLADRIDRRRGGGGGA